jgi:hypothetical protein
MPAGKTARKRASKKASQTVEAPRPPQPQELPPVAPTVTYRGGLLTIVASNSTLSDILTAVHQATGASVDAPAGTTDRVVTHLGPGQPRDVLTALLNGSRFDYILLSPAADPGGVRRLILRARSGGEAPASGASDTSGGALLSPGTRPAPGARTLPPDTSEDENMQPEETVEPAEEAPPEPQAQPAPAIQPGVRTPQQLQEELRRQQEEQRRQQQQKPEDQPPQ